MKIGVDIKPLTRQMTGIGRYTLEMCRALKKIPNISLYLYALAPIDNELTREFSDATIRTTKRYSRLAERIIWQKYVPRWAKADQLDIFWGPAHRLPIWLPKRIARVVTIHDLVWKYHRETMNWPSRLVEGLQMPLAIRQADYIIAISQATATAISKEFPASHRKLAVIPLGVTPTKPSASIDIAQQFNLNKPYCLFVGTIEPRKNLQRLLTAYANLPHTIKNDMMLVIVGNTDGWGNIDIKQMITQLHLDPHVRLLGYVDEAALAALYSHTQFLAMPSLYEGFGLPLIEAMARGKPVLTSNTSSMPEVAGDAGLLVNPTDVDSISAGLKTLITDSHLRQQLSAKALKNASHFDWDNAANQLVNHFKQAILKRRANE